MVIERTMKLLFAVVLLGLSPTASRATCSSELRHKVSLTPTRCNELSPNKTPNNPKVTIIPTSGYRAVDQPKSDVTCDRVTNINDCTKAGRQVAGGLGLEASVTAVSDADSGHPPSDPPYCYVENGKLNFNGDGRNEGPCGPQPGRKILKGSPYYDYCLCCRDDLRINTRGTWSSAPGKLIANREAGKTITQALVEAVHQSSFIG